MRPSRLGILPSAPAWGYLRRAAPELPFPLGAPGGRLFPDVGQALLHGVRALGLGDGDEVLVPAWHAGASVEVLVKAGEAVTGIGDREHGSSALDFYTELKVVYVDYTGRKREGNLY